MTPLRLLALCLVLGLTGCPTPSLDDDDATSDDDDDADDDDAANDDDAADDDDAANDDDAADDDDDTPVCGVIPTFEDGLSPTRVLHVATHGDDDLNDGSAALPWASIEYASTQLVAGDSLQIHAGTYVGRTNLDDVRGTADAPIWVGGAPGEAPPLLDASGGSEVMHVTRPRYLVLHDMVLQGSTSNGLNIDDGGEFANPDAARWVIVRGVTVQDVGSGGNNDCLKLSGLDDYWVLSSRFLRCGAGGSAIDHVGCHNGELAWNTIEDAGASGIQNKGGTSDVTIRWNHFLNGGARPVNMGGSTGYEFFRPPLENFLPNAEARNIAVIGNLIQGGQTGAAFVGCVFAQNTLLDPPRQPLARGAATSSPCSTRTSTGTACPTRP